MFSNRNCWRSMFEPSRIPFCRVVYVFELNSDCKLLSDPISLNFDLSNIVMFRGVWQDIVLFFVKREVFFARSHGYTGFPTLSGLFKLCLKMITIWFFSGLFLVQFCMCLVGLCSLLHDDTLGNWTVIAEFCLTFFPQELHVSTFWYLVGCDIISHFFVNLGFKSRFQCQIPGSQSCFVFTCLHCLIKVNVWILSVFFLVEYCTSGVLRYFILHDTTLGNEQWWQTFVWSYLAQRIDLWIFVMYGAIWQDSMSFFFVNREVKSRFQCQT